MPEHATSPPAAAGRSEIDADAGLMARVAAGDSAACRLLMEQHLRRLVGFAYRMLGDATEAEDIAQDAFFALWRQAPRWRPQARVGTWLYRVAHNAAIDRLRRRREVATDSLPERPDPAAGPAEIYEELALQREIARAIAALPERQRAALALVHEQGLSNIDAAATLEVSVEALESLLSRARRTLRQQLQDLKT